MDFSLSEEQIMLRDSVEKYVSEHCDTERQRRLSNSELGFDAAAWQQFAELGWLSVPFAESLGGFNGGAADLMVVTEAMGKGLVREPFLHTVVTCGALLQSAGSDEQQAQYIPAIIDGSTQWAFAFAERGSDFTLDSVSTRAGRQDDGFVLNGRKIAVLNGHCADQLIVSATTDEGLSLFIVPAGAAGVQREVFAALDGSKGATISFTDVALPAAALLGDAGAGLASIEKMVNLAIVAMGGESLGCMQTLLEATVEYTKTRNQFGQPISKFQVLQHRMADMYMKVEETRSLLLNAAIQLDGEHAEATAACAALKVKIADAGRYVSQEAVQLHGGIGMTDELNVGHHYKRLLLLSKLFGDEDYHLDRFVALSSKAA